MTDVTFDADRTPDAVRAYEVLDAIRANPNLHSQANWAQRTDCGTVMCFAGWTAHLNGDKLIIGSAMGYGYACRAADTGEVVSVELRAAQLLGLSREEAERLFLFTADGSVPDAVAEVFGPDPR